MSTTNTTGSAATTGSGNSTVPAAKDAPAAVVTKGQPPKASPSVRWFAIVLAVVLLGIAGVAGREAWLLFSSSNDQSWTQPVIDVLSTPELPSWAVAAGVGSIIVGLVFWWVAFQPRRRTHTALKAGETSVWVRNVDIARRATTIASRLPGVESARTTVNHRKVVISVIGDNEDAQLVDRVRDTVAHELSNLEQKYSITVALERAKEVESHV